MNAILTIEQEFDLEATTALWYASNDLLRGSKIHKDQLTYAMLINAADQRAPGFISGYIRRFWQVSLYEVTGQVGS